MTATGEGKDFWYLTHDADILVRLKGDTFEGMLISGMKALFATILLDYPTAYSPTSRKDFEFNGDTREDLLVDWLRKLLHAFSVDSVVPVNAVIRKISGTRYRAHVAFGEYVPGKSKLNTEIKAITYHNLKVWSDRGFDWNATVLFDV